MPPGPRPTLANVAHRAAFRFLPPGAAQKLKDLFGPVHFSGDYPSWEAARERCSGYAEDGILEHVIAGAREVKEGRAVYERDSRAFYEKAYEWPMLSCLLWAAAQSGGELSVLDFGGSLGSRYYQHRKWLADLKRVRWSVVEQEGFVRAGREQFQDDTLRFYPDIDSCVAAEKPNVLHISCVLQYLEKPYELIANLLEKGFDFIILDRTALIEGPTDRLTLQRVGKAIYPASYPAWFFARPKLLQAFASHYRLIEDFRTVDRANLAGTHFEGFLLERIGLRKDADEPGT